MNTLYYITEEISNVYMSLYEADPPDLNTAPQDPNATPQDPNVGLAPPTQDSNSIGSDLKLDPIKKYILLTKIVELKQYLELYAANTQSSRETRKLIKFIGVIIDFYDIFDYESLKDLSEGIMRASSKIIKQRGKK